MSDGECDGDMNVYERTLIRALIGEANAALVERDDDEQVVAAFLDGVSVQAVEVLCREVLRRRGAAEERA